METPVVHAQRENTGATEQARVSFGFICESVNSLEGSFNYEEARFSLALGNKGHFELTMIFVGRHEIIKF